MFRWFMIGLGSAVACTLLLTPLLTATKSEALTGVAPIASLVAGFGVPIWLARRRKASRAASSRRLAVEIASWFDALNRRRAFEPVSPSRAMLESGEFAVLAGDGAFIEMVDGRGATYVGTRVELGSRPIYLGSSTQAGPSWRTTDKGEVVMTNRRIAFVGGSRQVSIPWSDVVGLEPLLDGVKVAAGSSKTAVMFTVANGPLWAMAGKLLHKLRLESNALPEGEQFLPTQL